MSRALQVLEIRRIAPVTVLMVVLSLPVLAQENVMEILTAESYLRPPEEIARIALAPRHENVSLDNRSPDGKYFLHALSDGLPSIESFARPFYRLGGVQIDPEANRTRSHTTRTQVGFELIDWESGNTVRIDPPRGARVSSPSWSPDGSRLAYFAHFSDATHIYVYDIASGRARQITPRRTPAMTTQVSSFEWTADGGKILTVLVPEDRGEEPQESAVPQNPMVRLTEEGENSLRV